ncbi:MAG: hypothetical protein NVSMB19_16340 [Vulcanimicrobiaceae bacterium]
MYDRGEHEPLVADAWDAGVARTFLERLIGETDAAYDDACGWPLHPEDRDGSGNETHHGVYYGAAGTMWALVRLAQRYGVALRRDYGVAAGRCEGRYRSASRERREVVPSYFVGTVGIMAARYALTGDRTVLDRLGADMAANAGNPAREALWGSPGTALAALLVRERDGETRYDDVLRAVHDELFATWEPARPDGGLLWEQELYGRRCRYVGAGHGAIGNLAPLLRAADLLSAERRATLRERVPALLETYVLRDGECANWYSLGEPREQNRLQWCHGAAGVVMGLASYPVDDERVERLLQAGGEGIWQAGPLRKGPTLCHGTAGNGFALLRLGRRTGDSRWRERAERFAMHAMAQVAAWRRTFGMPSFSLWTGELGVALFIDAVLRDDPAVLTLDAM